MKNSKIKISLSNNLTYNLLVSFLLLLVLGYIDTVTGFELSFQFFYFIPLTAAAYNKSVNRFVLVLFSVAASVVWAYADIYSGHIYSGAFFLFWNTLSRLIVFTTFCLFLNALFRNRTKIKELFSKLSVQHEAMKDSIQYAKLIQDAIIPKFDSFKKENNESFMLSLSKDILSGDFFWHKKVGNTVVFGVIDCTGHGVPGALLSIAGNTLLNKIVVEYKTTDPTEIILKLKAEVKQLFNSETTGLYDGMEISIVSYNKDTKDLRIAQTIKGALLIKADGGVIQPSHNKNTRTTSETSSTNNNLNSVSYKIEDNTFLYLFTDGYCDQFGGTTKRGKFFFKRFEELLKNIHAKPAHVQKEILLKTIEDWKANHSQTDDITVVGTKF